MLSARGQAMSTGGLAPYIQAHVARSGEPGYVGLCVAENLQVFDLLRPKLQTFPAVPEQVVAYDDNAGRADLRQAVARLFEREVFGRAVDPAHVQVLAGAGSVLEALGHALGDPGDGVLVPTPSYAGFWPDLEVRPGLSLVPVPTTAADGFRLTPALLQAALDTADRPVRILLLTNPDNPRGQVMPAEDVVAVLGWANAQGLHVIADEIYALSVHDASGPFPSVGRLLPSLGERVHVVWAFSKDFGMSGLRTGVLVTEHEGLRRAVELQGVWQGVSGHTQHVLAAMLDDEPWLSGFLSTMRSRLRATADQVRQALTEAGIAHVPPSAGFFVLCDLRPALEGPTWEAEHALWARMLEGAGVNLTPGSALRSPEPGWFRLCFAAHPPEVVIEAIRRLGDHLSR